MEEEEEKPALSRKEQRKLKLMEYLAAKGRLKVPNPRPYLRENQPKTQSITSAPPLVKGKENEGPQTAVRAVGLKAAAAASRPDAGRKVLSVSNRVDVRGSAATSRKKTNIPVSTGAVGHSQNPELTRSAAAVSSRSGLRPAAGLEKQPGAAVQTSVRAAPKASRTLPSKPNSKSNPGSKPACPAASWTSSRVSLGPLTKTRTGLTPTVPQPRISKPDGLRTSSTSGAVPANKAASRRTAPGSASAPHPVMAVRAQQAGKLPQPPGEKQLWTGLKPSCAPSAPRPAGRSTEPRSAPEEKKPASHTSSKPAARAGFRAPSGRPQAAAAAAELGGKLQMSRGADSKTQNRSATVRTGAPAASQTVPQPVRAVSLTGRTANTKTPKLTARPVPHTEKKKAAAAQEERMWKLQQWRQARGISYKRPSMPVPSSVSRRAAAVSQPFWKSMKEEDEVQSLVCAVDRSLADCVALLEEGCPPDQVSAVLSRLPPVSHKFTKYWICRARLMERQGDLDVLPVFKEAVGVVVEPLDELRTVVFQILKRKNEIPAESDGEPAARCERSPEPGPDPGPESAVTPKPVRALIWGQNGDSSVIKYKITATPGGPPSQKRESARVNGQEVRFFTPVRRSVRIESHSRRYPAALQDHDPCVTSYHDLFAEEEGPDKEEAEPSEEGGEAPLYVYRENQALEDKVLVQLVCDDSA